GTAWIVAAGLVDAVDDGSALAVAERVERVECGTACLLGCPERDVVASLAHRLFEACQARLERCWQRLPWSAVATVGRAQGAKDRIKDARLENHLSLLLWRLSRSSAVRRRSVRGVVGGVGFRTACAHVGRRFVEGRPGHVGLAVVPAGG